MNAFPLGDHDSAPPNEEGIPRCVRGRNSDTADVAGPTSWCAIATEEFMAYSGIACPGIAVRVGCDDLGTHRHS